MLTVSHLMAEAALVRTESRGVHMRTDYPALDEKNLRKHLVFARTSQANPTIDASTCVSHQIVDLKFA